jgi:catechol 2,3-dioxygenase-like lactoylglutathione lyase family enzyme
MFVYILIFFRERRNCPAVGSGPPTRESTEGQGRIVRKVFFMTFNRLIPELAVRDFETSLHFYVQVLGFAVEYQRDESRFAMLSFEGSQIMIEEINDHWSTGHLERPFGRGVNFQIEVDEIDPIVDRLIEHQCPLFVEPKENWYRADDQMLGVREFLVQDPDGYLLRFSEEMGVKKST